MQTIINVLALASLGAMIQNFEYYQKFLQKLYLDIKPFNCTLCFTTWITLIYWLTNYGPLGIGLACLTGVVAEFIDRKLNEL